MSKLRGLLLAVTILPIAGCNGADDVASPGDGVVVLPAPTPPTTPTPTPPPPGTPAAACPAIAGVTDGGVVGSFRACRLPSNIITDLRLIKTAGVAYMIDGRVNVGVDLGGGATGNVTGRSAILTVDPGVILFGNGGDANNDFLIVNRGSRLQAEGTPTQPIIFTARENLLGTATDTSQGLWGGVILAGRAPVSDCDPNVSTSLVGGNAGCARIVEGTGNAAGGGEVANDSSGSVRYVQIRYSGVAISEGNELQGLTTVGAGSGTTIDHVQVHNSADDGVEVFGGRQNMKYLVITGDDDDSLDTDVGYQGAIQFVLAVKRTGNGSSDPRNLEVDSNNNREAAPRQYLRLANFTFVQPLNFESLQIRGGADAALVNGIVRSTGTGACLSISHPETIRAATNTPPADPGSGVVAPDRGPPVFQSIVFECLAPFAAGTSTTAQDVQNVFSAAGNTNNNANATNTLVSTYFPGPGAAAVTAFNAASLNLPGEAFLVATGFIGAISAANQAEYQGWTCNASYVNFGAASQNCTALPTS
jgi:hypothetical protein